MALTVSIKSTDVFGNKRVNVVEVGFDASYPTNGEPLTARDLGMSTVDFALFEPSAGYTFEYDHTNAKIKAYRSAGFTLTAHTHALHLNDADVADGATTRINAGANLLGANTGGDLAVAGVANTAGAGGIVAISGGTVAQAALAEVTDTTDLLALTNVRGLIVGS